jgi:hypothetical protein
MGRLNVWVMTPAEAVAFIATVVVLMALAVLTGWPLR